MPERVRDQSGYSLIEVMVAILLLSIAIIPMVSMFDAGIRAVTVGGNYDKGRALANQKMELVKALSYKEAVASYPPGSSPACSTGVAGFTCQISTTYLNPSTLDPDSTSKTVMKIDVTVRWNGGNSSYTTTGLLARGSI